MLSNNVLNQETTKCGINFKDENLQSLWSVIVFENLWKIHEMSKEFLGFVMKGVFAEFSSLSFSPRLWNWTQFIGQVEYSFEIWSHLND